MKKIGPFLFELRVGMHTDGFRRCTGSDPRFGRYVSRSFVLWSSKRSTESVDLATMCRTHSPRWRKQLRLKVGRVIPEAAWRQRMGLGGRAA